MYAFLLIKQATIITKANLKTQRILRLGKVLMPPFEWPLGWFGLCDPCWWLWVAVVGRKSGQKKARRTACVEIGCDHFGPSWELLWGFWWLPMVVEVLGGAKGSRWWQWLAAKWPKKGLEKSAESRRSIKEPSEQVDCGGGFGSIFRCLSDSIKIKHGSEFIVDIASFQLAQTLSNLMMFWLSKNALKLH